MTCDQLCVVFDCAEFFYLQLVHFHRHTHTLCAYTLFNLNPSVGWRQGEMSVNILI